MDNWNIFFSIGRLNVIRLCWSLRFDDAAVVRHVRRGIRKVDSICKIPLLSILLPAPSMKIPVLSSCQILKIILPKNSLNESLDYMIWRRRGEWRRPSWWWGWWHVPWGHGVLATRTGLHAHMVSHSSILKIPGWHGSCHSSSGTTGAISRLMSWPG